MAYNPTLYYDSGQEVTVLLEVDYRDGYGVRLDPITPVVAGVIKPSMINMDGFPISMSRVGLQVGLFYAKFYLPDGLDVRGTYLAVVEWINPLTMYQERQTYNILVGFSFGVVNAIGV